MTAFYFDTSAYLGVVLREPDARKISTLLRKSELYSSVLLVIEAQRNFLRLAREKCISVEEHMALQQRLTQDIQLFSLKQVDMEIVTEMSFPSVGLPRTLDLIHLRTALLFQQQRQDLVFVTLDKKQALSAQEMGLNVH